MPSGIERILPNGWSPRLARRPYRPSDEGIREWNPRPNPRRVVLVTERVSPSIRTAVGWLYPLERYDEKLTLDPLSQYAELLLIMGSAGIPDAQSVEVILQEARNRLTDPEYERLLGYIDLLQGDGGMAAATVE